jgi:hypothetical protein
MKSARIFCSHFSARIFHGMVLVSQLVNLIFCEPRSRDQKKEKEKKKFRKRIAAAGVRKATVGSFGQHKSGRLRADVDSLLNARAAPHDLMDIRLQAAPRKQSVTSNYRSLLI